MATIDETEVRKTKTKRQLIVPIAIVTIIVLIIIVVLVSNKKKIEVRAAAVPQTVAAMPVRISNVEQKLIDNNIQLTGSFEARQTLPLVAEAQGSIIELTIKEGQQISAGQIVARIDPTSIQSNLATAQASFNNAVKNKERYQRLADAGAISQKQYEDVALNVENARANLKNIQQQMKYTIIRSPMSGVVSEIKVERGSFATPGMQPGSVVDISRLRMIVKVDEQDVIKLKKGQPVSIRTEVYPQRVFTGTISLISVQADAGRKYDVEIEVTNNSAYPLKAGMFGTANLDAQNSNNAPKMFIPRQAIIGSIQDARVFVLKRDSTVTLRNIEVQKQNDEQVVVLNGLTPLEKVVISGQINLQEGAKVRVVK